MEPNNAVILELVTTIILQLSDSKLLDIENIMVADTVAAYLRSSLSAKASAYLRSSLSAKASAIALQNALRDL